MREKWIEQSAKTGVIERIDNSGDVYFYVTHAKDYDGRASMYHVWRGNKWLCCTADYRYAAELFDKEKIA